MRNVKYTIENKSGNNYTISFRYRNKKNNFNITIPAIDNKDVFDSIIQMSIREQKNKIDTKHTMDLIVKDYHLRKQGKPGLPECKPKYTLKDLEDKWWGKY